MTRWISALLCLLWLADIAGAQDDLGFDEEDDLLAEEDSEQEDILADGSDSLGGASDPGQEPTDPGGEAPGDEAQSDEDDSAPAEDAADEPAPQEGDQDLLFAAEPDTGDGEDADGRALRVRGAAGLGFGTLSYERPSGPVAEILPEAPFGAAELLLGAHFAPSSTLSLDVSVAYQTSIGLKVELPPLYALPERVPARYQRGDIHIAPVLKLAEGPAGVSLALPIGFAMQSFAPEVDQYSLASFFLGGPSLRLELRAPIGEVITLRIAPEAQWIVVISERLADQGACCQGFGVGGQGAIEAAVGPTFRAALAYRESRSFAPAAWRFRSVERFLTARLAGEF